MALLSCIVKPLAYLSLPVILLRSISAVSPVGRYYTRVFAYLGAVASVATASIATAATLAFLGRTHDVCYYTARLFYAVTSRLMDIKVEVEGQEHLENRPAVIMNNHQSALDLMIIGQTMPKRTSILAKKSLRFTPLGPFMMLSGAVFIDRGNNAQAIKSLEAATDLMKRLGVSVFMYPEGTRHGSPVASMLPFKKGGFHMAVQAGIPILPVVTQNYWHIWRPGFIGSGTIKVRVLPPISTEGLSGSDINDLMKRVQDQMVETLREISIHALQPEKAEAKVPPRVSTCTEKMPVLSGVSLTSNPPTPSTDTSPRLGGPKGSSASLASSMASSQQWRSTGSEAGVETEEDEGMILVGRPD